MIQLTESAKKRLEEAPEGTVYTIPFDPGSCDIVNNVYEIKGIPDRELEEREKKLLAEGIEFIVDRNFDENFDGELVIDYSSNHLVLRNKNQIFNSRVRLSIEK
ncbi:iron-sulfur cluster biosynthesis family protein [Bacillus mangrovi]|uniref:Iron-sulfur cluster biosynthesis family protein n=1 Tax=Metabacillus mangrovi TaxID=1491830 RepID=A0A7X2S8Q5_9BACI|nr:iron-sulfur cluster biosynthesis family protein [Metabacillus mangrovi]MTH55447.1 iron-sulfur cluster biosynthesis family protein [Metabacillus mangrovi]